MLTIERLHTGKVLLPAHVLAIDLAEIAYKKGVFISRLASFMVDTLNAPAESITNHLLGNDGAIVIGLQIKTRLLVDENRIISEVNRSVRVQSSCCHYHIP